MKGTGNGRGKGRIFDEYERVLYELIDKEKIKAKAIVGPETFTSSTPFMEEELIDESEQEDDNESCGDENTETGTTEDARSILSGPSSSTVAASRVTKKDLESERLKWQIEVLKRKAILADFQIMEKEAEHSFEPRSAYMQKLKRKLELLDI